MTTPHRIFMDVSYTRTQHVNVGITRTVRRLEEELRRLHLADGGTFAAVSFHSGGFRELAPGAFSSPVSRGAVRASDKPAARLFRWITGAFFRKVVLAALFLPWPVLRFVWSITSQWTFDFLSRSEPRVKFVQGDVLLLCDASWNYPVWVAARRARAEGARVVLLMYDLIPLRHPEFCFALVPHIFGLWLDQMARCSDEVICISKATQDDLQAYAGEMRWELPSVRHFRLGSDPSVRTATQPPRSELREFMGDGLQCFTAIGSFEPKKNYGFLLVVFQALWARGVQAKLLIIGRATSECEALVSTLRRHPQQGRCLLTLFDASDAEVAFAYANSSALLFPSLAEGFGLPLVEARARGCRVIASDLPAFLELAEKGTSFYPRHSASALETLILEDLNPVREDVGVVPAFTWQDSARQLRGIVMEQAAASRREDTMGVKT
jgi:glycosyltransferase involved in cell wall biosynthesis